MTQYLRVFCDGSTSVCYGRHFSGYGVFFGKRCRYNLAGASAARTSTMAELIAIREAYRMIAYRNTGKNYEVCTDCLSAYTMVNRHAFVSPYFNIILNQIWRCERATEGEIRVAYVKAHTKDLGNNMAHQLANLGRKKGIMLWKHGY
ncbi:Hypothetical protein YALIH222_S06E02630G [Yarrowia lipolytica]|nr:Hypothetical protein YALIH222_S06E02630G [Yarrowia lipolytica]